MGPHSLRVLEYGAIRERVVRLAACSLGQERAREMAPSLEEEEVRRLQVETAEAVRLLSGGGGVPLGGVHDIRPALQIAAVGGMLEPHALLQVADTLSAGRKLRAYLLQRRDQCSVLSELAGRILELRHVEDAVYGAISEQAEVRDDASPLLSRLRREMRTIRGRMTERLNSIIRSPGHRDMIQDPVITTRDGRYCIPVKSEYRTQFGGLVHDQSSSGATVFMEPASVVELGNELRQVELKERAEVERILRQLTGMVGQSAEDIRYSVEAIGDLDFIVARARLALEMNAVEPILNRDGFIGLRRARHPLLTGDVVPIDIDLGREKTVIVITGPNTGGKTVSLKTVGLLTLMAQSGLQIPAHEGSTLSVFRGVYADIGDEQSIQQSLSTFSGHITNIAGILEQVERTGAKSLVLLDEVGAGTDPTEGAALAKSILQHLLQRGARTIATTHYGELKEFAYSTPGVENASVEFDTETLRPTYRLLIGIPGTSNAFAISARLGLPLPIVESARSLIGTDRTVLSEVIQRLTEEQRETEQDLRKAAQTARDLEAKQARLEQELQRAEKERAEILSKARAQAEEMVRSARREMDRVRDEIRRLEKQARRASEQQTTTPTGLQQVREKLTRASGRMEQRAERVTRPRRGETDAVPEAAPQPAPGPLAAGDVVWISGLNQRGTLVSIGEDDRGQVLIGSMRMTVPLENLQKIHSATPATRTPAPSPASRAAAGALSDMRLQARANISPEVNLRGMRAEEAIQRLDEYLDDACLAGISPIRVVHGKGTGALKRVVWELLQQHPHVSGYSHPSEEEGGAGATVVTLKE
ncbi:MAG: endonuclease MutS2 [Armatimonadota bacterium]